MILGALTLLLTAQKPAPKPTPPTAAKTPAVTVPKPPVGDQILFTVNGAPIRANEVEGYLWDWRGNEVAQDLVTYQLIRQEAAKSGIQVTPAEIGAAIQAQMAQFSATMMPGTDIESVLRSRGFPKSRLYMKVHSELILDRLALKSFAPDNFIRISTLAYSPKGNTPKEMGDATQRAQSAYTRLAAGGDWNKELTDSDDPDTLKSQHGVLGWRLVNAFPEPIRAELRTAKIGAITHPTQAGGAVQIFRLEARGGSTSGPDLEELKKGYLESERQKTMARIRASAKITQVYVAPPQPQKG